MKKTVITTALVVAMFGAGTLVGAQAAITWQGGHENIQVASSNIDKLVAKIQALQQSQQQVQQDLNNAKSQLNDSQSQYAELQKQKVNSESSLNNQIQEKIAEGNRNVAAKQKEIDELNKKINYLISSMTDKEKNEQQLSQALIDAQAIKDKSQQAVDQYGK